MDEKFQSIIDSMFQAVPNTKGIAMHIEAPDRKISWTGATGWADQATERKMQPDDPARIASVTKTYVAAAILRLVDQGKIRLGQPINDLISEKSAALLDSVGYAVSEITVAQMVSHTSGIKDYVDTDSFQNLTLEEPKKVWTRDEQIALAMSFPPKAGPAQEFSYSETGYLLLTEIIERQTDLPFHTAMRQLLSYEQYGLNETWFELLEQSPAHLSPLVHQFAGEFKVESYGLNATFDLFGGGGIAATTKDVALFTQLLFNGKLFDNPETKELLYHTVATADGKDNAYYMGIARTELGPYTCYGHGGFWGTTTQYFPEFNASVCIFLMERDEWAKYQEILHRVAEVLDTNK